MQKVRRASGLNKEIKADFVMTATQKGQQFTHSAVINKKKTECDASITVETFDFRNLFKICDQCIVILMTNYELFVCRL